MSRLRNLPIWLVDFGPIVALVGGTLYTMAISLFWHSIHDSALMLYVGFAMEHLHKVPYRDIFDMNPPGTHLLYAFIVALTDSSEFGIRAFDVAALLGTQICMVLFLRKQGLASGLVAAALFGNVWLRTVYYALQRESLAMVPLALSLVLGLRTRWPLGLRLALVGLLHGAMVSIKPPLLITTPWLVAAMLKDAGVFATIAAGGSHRERLLACWRASLLVVAGWGGGLLVLPVALACYLGWHGALDDFSTIAREYWPLYASLDGRGQIVTPGQGWVRLESTARILLVVSITVPLAAAIFDPLSRGVVKMKTDVLLIAGLLLGGVGYAYLGGKFWSYHSIPYAFAGSLAVGLLVTRRARSARPFAQRFVQGLAAVAFIYASWSPPDQADRILAGKPFETPAHIVKAADQLKARLRSGDKVQPLDVTGGAVHAMWLARAEMATRFMYDFQFYHHVDRRYIQNLRLEFLAAMTARPPRFVLRPTKRPGFRARGHGSDDFLELRQLLFDNYREVWKTDGLELLEWMAPLPPKPASPSKR